MTPDRWSEILAELGERWPLLFGNPVPLAIHKPLLEALGGARKKQEAEHVGDR
jgi:hypothetical protein